jgi:hypothetical protein
MTPESNAGHIGAFRRAIAPMQPSRSLDGLENDGAGKGARGVDSVCRAWRRMRLSAAQCAAGRRRWSNYETSAWAMI